MSDYLERLAAFVSETRLSDLGADAVDAARTVTLDTFGAILAGTSYQAFGYEIKCAGRRSCSWTSWWEVTYLIFQQLSMDAMLVAVAYSSTGGFFRTLLLAYALATAVLYVILAFMGGLVPIRSFVTFDLMVRVSMPLLLIFLALNGWRYCMHGSPMDLAYLGTWIGLLLITAAYRLYPTYAQVSDSC